MVLVPLEAWPDTRLCGIHERKLSTRLWVCRLCSNVQGRVLWPRRMGWPFDEVWCKVSFCKGVLIYCDTVSSDEWVSSKLFLFFYAGRLNWSLVCLVSFSVFWCEDLDCMLAPLEKTALTAVSSFIFYPVTSVFPVISLVMRFACVAQWLLELQWIQCIQALDSSPG